MKLSISEQLTYSTVRIECTSNEGKSTGTGFFYTMNVEEKYIPVIVTNKHVIEDSKDGLIHFNLADNNGDPIEGEYHKVEISSFESSWIKHPNPEVDLCILTIGPILNKLERSGIKPFYIQVDQSLIMNNDQLKELNSIEDIVMVGYPNGIWDAVNNMPIIRKGITATHPGLNYNGKQEFMIDAACFPGSSGSPVFLYNPSSYNDKNGNTIIGSRIKLLGILYAGPQHTASGEVKIINVPTAQKPIAISRIPNNLGLIIKSYILNEFEPILKELI
ncbi:S1 family peptidase [Guptibacillus hwajinpoensis]|uniref:Zinc chelation protein SecC n=1 Tax=Guptibacillus hwajinpoensis TaxID=208199 RepID=A0A0J6CT36_9BACL|nr:serine protease [Alkalihalobacillus macyae]KMM36358.1 zinc chelation protein SecC [Alkalihalobacillus macyae]